MAGAVVASLLMTAAPGAVEAAPPPPGLYPVGATPIELNQPADPFIGAITPAADAPERGMFSAQIPWPLIPIHAVLTNNGHLTTYGTPTGQAVQAGTVLDDWNPATDRHVQTATTNAYNAFCNGIAPASTGQLVMVGGNTTRQTQVYDPRSRAQSLGPNLNRERWYASVLRRPDNQILVLGGADYYNVDAYRTPGDNSRVATTPEIGDGSGAWRSLTGANSLSAFGAEGNRWWYPRAYNAPDGSVFGVSSNQMWRLDPSGSGSIRDLGTIPLTIGASGSSVMFDRGRILFAGGGQAANGHGVTATNAAAVVDINGPAPVVTGAAPMARQRNWLNLTVLANGEVLANGGTVFGADAGGSNAVREVEIWDPATGAWRTGASAARIRTYHSTALLLPSGAVFTGGGGVPGPEQNLNAEWYLPPHLFSRQAGGSATWASRPTITSIAGSLTWGGRVDLTLAATRPIASASLISLGNVTHSYNADQRRIPLAISQTAAAVSASLPANVDVLPPGAYLLQVVDAAGVPSPSQIVTLRTGEPGQVTVYENPAGTGGGGGSDTVVGLDVGTTVRFESTNYPGHHLRHAGYRARIDPISALSDLVARLDASWTVRTGLASGSGRSFESVNYPGHFLRAEPGGEVWLRQNDDSEAFAAAATFRAVPGLTGELTSLQSWLDPSLHLRHRGFLLWVERSDGSAVARADATFAVRAGFEQPVTEPGSVSGTVTNGDGSGADGVAVDLFARNADGTRGTYLSSTTTGPDGVYRFDVDPACYVVTFIAPDGRTFTSGIGWLEADPCVTSGRGVTGVNARLNGGGATGASIAGTITDQGDSPAAGIGIDLFTALADGSRASWVASTTTDGDGGFRFAVTAGCHIVTVIAPAGGLFTNGDRWTSQSRCPTAGQSVTGVDARLTGGAASVAGTITDGSGSPVAGVAVDLFATLGDGSRGTYLRSSATDSDGAYRFDTAAGCHVVTVVAPTGRTFANGNTWRNLTGCPTTGQALAGLDARLN